MGILTQSKANVIIDGQWGSCGKGKLAGYLCGEEKVDLAVCDFMPNAGHTFVDNAGKATTTRQLPTASVFGIPCCIGPHAAIDLDLFLQEVRGTTSRIYLHPLVPVICDQDKTTEKNAAQYIAATMKGGHAAGLSKILREPRALLAKDFSELQSYLCDTQIVVQDALRQRQTVLIETAQGFDLGLNHGHQYPYVTGRDCLVGRALDNAGVAVRHVGSIIACLRTFPIRVGSIEGGSSGPCYADQREMTWEEIGVPAEMTTVTKRVRRVFSFGWDQVARMCRFIGPTHAFLNFVNYLDGGSEDAFVKRLGEFLRDRECQLSLLGTGPKDDQMLDVSSRDW